MAAIGHKSRFELGPKLGEGGMGIVYKAYDRQRDMPVAIKTLRRLDASSLYRFKREFRKLSDLSHPNIVALYELVSEGDDWFLTMELVEGPDFIQYIREGRQGEDDPQIARTPEPLGSLHTATAQGPDAGSRPDSDSGSGSDPDPDPDSESIAELADLCDETRLRDALAQLAQALHALHAKGMVHRDLKPSNIRISDKGRVVLMDFGIVSDAKQLIGHTGSHSHPFAGTPAFMAPEQAAGERPTVAADWYGFGVLAYLALTGRLPHRGTTRDILDAKQAREPRPIRTLVPDVPDDLAELTMDLLARRPADRPLGIEVLARLGVATHDDIASAPRLAAAHPFVGRNRELTTLSQAYRDTLGQRTVCVFVRGVAGIGKTTLVKQFLREVERADEPPIALTGRCHERESLSYRAFDGIVDDLSRKLLYLPSERVAAILPGEVDLLPRLFPVLRRVPGIQQARPMGACNPSELRARALGVLRELLSNLADYQPLVLHIDNLQWVDRDSLDVLSELLKPPALSRIMLVLSLRTPLAASPDPTMMERIAALSDQYATSEIELAPMISIEQRVLATRLLESLHLPGVFGDLFWRQSGGNPRVLVELARYVAERPDILSSDAPLRPSMEDLIIERIERLPDSSRALLDVVAVAGESTPLWVLAKAADVDIDTRERDARSLCATQLTELSRPGHEPHLAVYHDAVSATLLTRMSGDRKRELHRRLAGAMERWDHTPVDVLARHWLAADDPEQAQRYLVSAAHTALDKLSFDRAADLYRAALSAIPDSRDEHHEILKSLGDALALAGRCREASEVYDDAAARASGGHAIELRRLAADNLLRSGHIADGLARLAGVARELGVPMPATRKRAVLSIFGQRARLAVRGRRYTRRSEADIAPGALDRLDSLYATATSLAMIDHLPGAAMQLRHLSEALRCGEEKRICRAMAVDLFHQSVQGGRKLARAQKLSREILLQARRIGDPYVLGIAHVSTGGVAIIAGQFQRATHSLTEAIRILTTEVRGAQWEITQARYLLAACHIAQGEIGCAAPIVSQALDVAERVGDLYARTAFGALPNVWRWLAQDRSGDALDYIEQLVPQWPDEPVYLAHHRLDIGRALVHLYRGDADALAAALADIRTRLRSLYVSHVPWRMVELHTLEAQAAILRGDRADARAAASRVARAPLSTPQGFAIMIRATIAQRDGDIDDAQRLWSDAIHLLQEGGSRHYAAAARCRLSDLLGERERPAEAQEWFTEQAIANPSAMLDFLAPQLG